MMRVLRTAILILLFLGGLGSILYGSFCHVLSVEEEKTREITIAVPTLSGVNESLPNQGGGSANMLPLPPRANDPGDGDVDPFHSGGPPPDMGNPFETPSMIPSPPGLKYEKVTETYTESRKEPEWAIVREVTVGGVVLLADGRLKRTYTGQPPSLCPT